MISGIIYAIGGFILSVIGLRFVLRLLGANPGSAFVDWIYSFSSPFVAPFSGIFGQEVAVTGPGVVTASVFDWTALIALLVIGLILGLIGSAFGRTRHVVR